jgi:hypothetical protein
VRALFPDEARELGVRDSDWELLVEELVEVLSTQFTCFTSTKVHIEARELGVRDSDWELLVEELVEVLSTFVFTTSKAKYFFFLYQ